MSGGGLLDGVRVVELACDLTAFAGKLLVGLGADVVLVEPPGGAPQRRYGPFYRDEPGPEHSLWWWHYQAAKRSVTLDLRDGDLSEALALIESADVVLEGERPGALAAIGIDHHEIRARAPRLVWVSVTPFGQSGPRSDEAATDLTLAASGGLAWSCGYDDHALPPVRPGGYQALQTAGMHAAIGALIALVDRDVSGKGQHVDVSANAAVNVTTEMATYEWMVAGATVQRQTGRHAMPVLSEPVWAVAADGRRVHTGVPPRDPQHIAALLEWVDEVGARDDFADVVVLELAIERGGISFSDIGYDPLVTEMFRAAREALVRVASKVTARDFFLGAQRRGLVCAQLNHPDDVMQDPHMVARGFPVPIEQVEGEAPVLHAGAPFVTDRPWCIDRRAPHIGEHTAEVLGALRASERGPARTEISEEQSTGGD